MRSIAIREELTEEWNSHGVKKQIEYAILTAEISKATFGLPPIEYKGLKGLKKQNLRDHMTDLELIFSMFCLLYTSPSPRDRQKSRMPSSA